MPSGGARPNAGRPRKGQEKPKQFIEPVEPKVILIDTALDEEVPSSIAFLDAVVKNATLDVRTRIDAAKALAPFQARKKGDTGVKEERERKARSTASKFSVPQPPKLVSRRS